MTNTSAKPHSRPNNLFQRLARTSCIAPLIAVGLGLILMATDGGRSGFGASFQRVVGPALILLGLAAGILSLLGMARVGRSGILIPGLVGTLLSLALVTVNFFPGIYRSKPTRLQPAVHAEGQQVLKDERLGLTLDIPAGFAEFPAGQQAEKADYMFVKGDTSDRELDLLFSVSALPAALPKTRLRPGPLGTNTNITVRTVNWRGLDVDTLVVSELLLGTPFTTFNIQIPTVPRAIHVRVAGPAARQAELEQIVAALLPSIDAQSNW